MGSVKFHVTKGKKTPGGFDLYVCDSPNGAADYEATIAIPEDH